MDQGIGDCDGAHGVVRKERLGVEERLKVLRPVVVEFVHGTDDVTDDRTQRGSSP